MGSSYNLLNIWQHFLNNIIQIKTISYAQPREGGSGNDGHAMTLLGMQHLCTGRVGQWWQD